MAQLVRVRCRECRKYRVFLVEDLFDRDFPRYVQHRGDMAIVTKPCPSCGAAYAIRIKQPPEQAA
jgi:predicted RNA-binding Zn-ribbon protein involved in translation (DUF1610 family)